MIAYTPTSFEHSSSPFDKKKKVWCDENIMIQSVVQQYKFDRST